MPTSVFYLSGSLSSLCSVVAEQYFVYLKEKKTGCVFRICPAAPVPTLPSVYYSFIIVATVCLYPVPMVFPYWNVIGFHEVNLKFHLTGGDFSLRVLAETRMLVEDPWTENHLDGLSPSW